MTLLQVVKKILIRRCCVYESAVVVTQPGREQQTAACEFTQKTHKSARFVFVSARREAAVTETTAAVSTILS